jgi:hypothetical protein
MNKMTNDDALFIFNTRQLCNAMLSLCSSMLGGNSQAEGSEDDDNNLP